LLTKDYALAWKAGGNCATFMWMALRYQQARNGF